MPAAKFEPNLSTDGLPVFVAEGRRRQNAVRLVKITIGLALAGWLAALAAGLTGFAPLPLLPLPGADQGHTAPVVRPQGSGDPPVAGGDSRPSSSAGGRGQSATPVIGAPRPTTRTSTPTQPRPPGAATTSTPSAHGPPSTPPSSGQQIASSPEGPGATTSPDGPGATTSPDGSGGTTSPDGSGGTTLPGSATSPDAPVSGSLPTG